MRLRLAPVLALPLLLVPVVVTDADADPPGRATTEVVATSWSEAGGLSGRVDLSAGVATVLTVDLDGGRISALPEPCRNSTVVRRHSYVSADGTRLVCELRASGLARTVSFPVDVRSASAPLLWGSARTSGGAVAFAPQPLPAGDPAPPRDLRLLSSPDFLNADIADLRRGPGNWTPGKSENGTNALYQRAIANVLDDWASLSPDGVLVAGDLVDGRWGRDQRRTGNFGPVGTLAQRRLALARAARTYYPQWLERFTDRDLEVFAAIGDHEYGDDKWPRSKRVLAPDFAAMFAEHLTVRPNGTPRFQDRPKGPHELTAYAWRPAPDVQVVSLDQFDIGPQRVRLRLDRAQLRWVSRVLARAQSDGVTWIVVQGHLPILEPVRSRASSRLSYAGGKKSALWKLFRRYGVDLYLCGEVHDVTASVDHGVVQLAHGGAFQFGLTTYALLDFTGDRLEVRLNDYASTVRDAADGSRLWETVRDGIMKIIRIGPRPFTIGTMVLDGSGVVERSGVLEPWDDGPRSGP